MKRHIMNVFKVKLPNLAVSILIFAFSVQLFGMAGLARDQVIPPTTEWKAGIATSVITPDKPMWMAGYAARNKPSEGKVHDL